MIGCSPHGVHLVGKRWRRSKSFEGEAEVAGGDLRVGVAIAEAPPTDLESASHQGLGLGQPKGPVTEEGWHLFGSSGIRPAGECATLELPETARKEIGRKPDAPLPGRRSREACEMRMRHEIKEPLRRDGGQDRLRIRGDAALLEADRWEPVLRFVENYLFDASLTVERIDHLAVPGTKSRWLQRRLRKPAS